jgi:hypothetical protein
MVLGLLVGSLGYVLLHGVRSAAPAAFLAIGAVGAMVVYALSFVDITLGLALLVASISLSPELPWAGFQDLRLEDFLVPALLLSWLGRAGKTREPLTSSPLHGPLILYLAAVGLSTALALATGTQASRSPWLILAKYIEYYMIYLLFLNTVRSKQEFQALALFAVMSSVASCLVVSIPMADPTSRVHGPSGETANIYGGYLAINLAIVVGLLLQARTFRHRLAASSAVVILGLTLLYTFSRTSFAAVAVGCILFGILKDRRLLAGATFFALLLPTAAPTGVWERLSTISRVVSGPDPDSWAARLAAWNTALSHVFSTSPLLGNGLGSVKFGDVDSEYVRIVADSGILGLALFSWVLWRMGRQTWTVLGRLAPGTFGSAYAAGFLMALTTMAVHAVAATTFTSIRSMECFMVLAGLFGSLAARHAEWGLEAPALRAREGDMLVILPSPAPKSAP